MPDLLIRIKKKADGAAALSCTRADGTVTWQRQEGQLGRFFPLHDLTHYSVESALGIRRAFYGLLAEGWDISDFGKLAMRVNIPEEALLVEMIVGYFDLERMTGELGTAADYNERIRTKYIDEEREPLTFRLTDADIDRIRALRAETFARWNALPPGEAMEVSFERSTDGIRLR